MAFLLLSSPLFQPPLLFWLIIQLFPRALQLTCRRVALVQLRQGIEPSVAPWQRRPCFEDRWFLRSWDHFSWIGCNSAEWEIGYLKDESWLHFFDVFLDIENLESDRFGKKWCSQIVLSHHFVEVLPEERAIVFAGASCCLLVCLEDWFEVGKACSQHLENTHEVHENLIEFIIIRLIQFAESILTLFFLKY